MRAVLIGLTLVGCADTIEKPAPGSPPSSFCAADAGAFSETGPATPATPIAETAIADSTCAAIERQYTPEPSPHLEDCSAVSYSTDPPSSGPHYEDWAKYQIYDEPVPHGFLVHSMEHGAVVFFYSCTACADEVEQAKAVIDGLPVDPGCAGSDVTRRVILTPDPLLEARWAAAVWGITLNAGCFEPAVFDAFARAHYASAPENFCSGGVGP